jgi:hypothetical protein
MPDYACGRAVWYVDPMAPHSQHLPRRDQSGGHSFRRLFDHFIKSMRTQFHAFMLDGRNAGPQDQQVHQEIGRLYRIIGTVGVDPFVVLWKSNIVDAEFSDHMVGLIGG